MQQSTYNAMIFNELSIIGKLEKSWCKSSILVPKEIVSVSKLCQLT